MTEPPSVAAARAAFRPLPPGTATIDSRPVDLPDRRAGRPRRAGRSTGSPRRRAAACRPVIGRPLIGRPARRRAPRRASAWPSTPPAARVDSAPQTAPSSRLSRRSPPSSHARRKPGVERVARAGRVDRLDRHRRDANDRARRPRQASAPAGAELDRDDRAAVGTARRRRSRRAPAAAASTSSMPAIRRASAAFGKKTSAARSISRDAAVPALGRVPVRVERRRQAALAGRGEERRQPVAARLLEVERTRVEVPRPADQRRRDRVDVERADRAHRGQHRPVACRSSGSRSRRSAGAGRRCTPRRRSPRPAIASSMNRPNASSPTTPTERDPEPESRRAAGEDRRRAADGHPDRADDPLDLAEDGHRVRDRRRRCRG